MHPSLHFYWTLGLLVATMALLAVVTTRILKRRLAFAGIAFLLAIVVHIVVVAELDPTSGGRLNAQSVAIEGMLIAFGAIAAIVALALNPWRQEQTGGVPAIVQDALVALIQFAVALVLFQDSSFFVGVAGSAIVVGLALQDTLGNAFAGLALQVERPFRVGHWIAVGDHQGKVVEVTWRATKIATKSGNLVVVPNSEIAKTAITNFSQPAGPTRLSVDVGASYNTPPNETREAMLAAVRRAPGVLSEPPPDALLVDFGGSSLNYRTRFWIGDFQREEAATSAVRTAIYYEFGRRGIEIPYPIQVEYSREEVPVDRAARRDDALRMIGMVPVFRVLPEDARVALAEATNVRLFADGETIVREGEPGGTMYLVKRGLVVITVGPTATRVAVTESGGYFGEMSLLTGEPRTATVTADGDCTLLEIAASDFRSYVQSHPDVLEGLAAAAARRRQELDAARSGSAPAAAADHRSLVDRMRRFFGLE